MLSVSVPLHKRLFSAPARFHWLRFCPAAPRGKWIGTTAVAGVLIFLSGCGVEAPKENRSRQKPQRTEKRIEEPSAKNQSQAPAPVPVPPKKLWVRFVDGVTGADIRPDNVLLSTKAEEKELSGNESGSELLLDPGDYKIGVIAQGYQNYTGNVTALPSAKFKVRFILDPVEDPVETRAETLDSLRRQGYMILQGYVVADDTGELLSDVAVTANDSPGGTTDQKGFFRLQIPVGPVPGAATLRLKRPGFVTHMVERVGLWSAGDATYRLRLKRTKTLEIKAPVAQMTNVASTNGAGPIETNNAGVSNSAPGAVEISIADTNVPVAVETNLPATATNEAPTVDLPTNQPSPTNQEVAVPVPVSTNYTNVLIPRSIRVLNSDGITIDHVSMARYEKSVLGAEWIPMWASYDGGSNSLCAGALAVRCYAIWKINHSIPSRQYDICGTAACQVYNPRRSFSAVDTAVNYTRDWALVSNGEIAHAEYSAENNSFDQEDVLEFPCADGFTSPRDGCLEDPICSGQDRYGHGRGMCQWGSARWATGRRMNGRISSDATTNGYPMKDWLWIVKHYYPKFALVNLRTGEEPFPMAVDEKLVEMEAPFSLTNSVGTNSVPEIETNSVPEMENSAGAE